MGTYHTFFVATDADLDRLFPGWKPVKPKPVVKHVVNPFTQQTFSKLGWDPVEKPKPLGKRSLYTDTSRPPVPPIVPPANEYMADIEEACAPGLRALPHFRAKNFDCFIDLEPLAVALSGKGVLAPPARVGHEGDDDIPTVAALPAVATESLAALEDVSLERVVRHVLEACPVYDGEEAEDPVPFFVAHAMRPLRALAVEALRSGGRVCHYCALHY